jgi:hypothetical protein
VADDGGVVARCAGERTTVANLLLDVADDRTLRALRKGEDVANGERGPLAGVNERSSVETLGRDEGLGAELVAVRVAEDDAGKGSTTERKSDGAPFLKWKGRANRPASWMISFTIPRT